MCWEDSEPAEPAGSDRRVLQRPEEQHQRRMTSTRAEWEAPVPNDKHQARTRSSSAEGDLAHPESLRVQGDRGQVKDLEVVSFWDPPSNSPRYVGVQAT
jgi:hypothetical protein